MECESIMSTEECLKEQLFCSMYDGLIYLTKKYRVSRPNVIWSKAIKILKEIDKSKRKDILLYDRLGVEHSYETLAVLMVILYVTAAMKDENCKDVTDVEIRIVKMLSGYRDVVNDFYQRIRESEEVEEQGGRFVEEFDYREKREVKMKLSDKEMAVLDEILGYAKRGCWKYPATDENVAEWLKTMFGVGKMTLDESDMSDSRAFREFFIKGKGSERRAVIAFSNVLGFMSEKRWLDGSMKYLSLMFFNDENQHTNINNGKGENASKAFKDLMPFMKKHAKNVIR